MGGKWGAEMSDLWPEIKVKPTKETLKAEINYLFYRLQQLGEEPDRLRVYRDKIDQIVEEL